MKTLERLIYYIENNNGKKEIRETKLLSMLKDVQREHEEELRQVKSVDLAVVGGSLHAKTCKVVNDNDDEFPCDVTTCCSVGPITRENYCPNCGAKIERQ